MFSLGKTIVVCFNIDESLLMGRIIYLPSQNSYCGRVFVCVFFSLITIMHCNLGATL